MKKKKLVKKALEHPELFAPAELTFFEKWLQLRKERKERKRFTNVKEEYTDSVDSYNSNDHDS